MRLASTFCTLIAGAALISSCSDGGGPVGDIGTGEIRADAACEVQGLTKPLRQTVVLVDARALQRSANGDEFAVRNTAFRDLILSIADPSKAVGNGTTAARERVTIAVVPADGSAAEVAFTGCLPGMSADELAQANRNQSALTSVFSAGPAGQMEKQAEEFRTRLIGGMVEAAKKADGGNGTPAGSVEGSRFLQGVRGSRALLETRKGVQRLVLVSDLSRLDLPPETDPLASFTAGSTAGAQAGGDLGHVELHVVLPAGRPLPNRAYLRGYFLAQQALLASIAAGHLGPSPAPPVRLWHFAGEADYPSRKQLVDIRIGDDGQGKLASAWLTVIGDPRFAIPLTGQIICTAPDSCKITSDNAGFAQIWTGRTAGAAHFSNDLPFGGMRNFTLQIDGNRLTGRASDPDIFLEPDRNRNWIGIAADAKQ